MLALKVDHEVMGVNDWNQMHHIPVLVYHSEVGYGYKYL